MTTQAELDEDLLAVLEQHLATRRDLLKKVKAELYRIPGEGHHLLIPKRDVIDVLDRLIAEAELPTNGS